MLVITNDGPLIKETNYWTSTYAARGVMYLSWNAGAGRLLVPRSQEHLLKEIKSAKYVIVSKGRWDEAGSDGFELLFEDESDSPFCVHLQLTQSDRSLPENNQGGGFKIDVWTENGKHSSFDGKFRIVDSIPNLQPWRTH